MLNLNSYLKFMTDACMRVCIFIHISVHTSVYAYMCIYAYTIEPNFSIRFQDHVLKFRFFSIIKMWSGTYIYFLTSLDKSKLLCNQIHQHFCANYMNIHCKWDKDHEQPHASSNQVLFSSVDTILKTFVISELQIRNCIFICIYFCVVSQ